MRLKLLYSVVALALLPLILFNWNSRVAPIVRNVGGLALKPFLSAADSLTSSGLRAHDTAVHFWRTFQMQAQDESELVVLRRKVKEDEELRRENARLNRLLDFKEKQAPHSVAARVIGWDISPWRRVAIIDRGSHGGVRKDMAVVSAEGLAGRIFEVGAETARVMVLTDPESRVSAFASESRGQGVVSGDGSNALSFDYLEPESRVGLGETVLTLGVMQRTPKGIPIGKVESLTTSPDGLHLVAVVNPFAALNRLEEVLCLDSQPSDS